MDLTPLALARRATMIRAVVLAGEHTPAICVSGTEAAIALLQPRFAGLTSEQLCVAYLDADLCLLNLVLTAQESVNSVMLSLRGVIREALALDARAIILAHNHPGGSAAPSVADQNATRRLAETGRGLGIRLIDHLLFVGADAISFRALGLL